VDAFNTIRRIAPVFKKEIKIVKFCMTGSEYTVVLQLELTEKSSTMVKFTVL